jgi:hypothetical protein
VVCTVVPEGVAISRPVAAASTAKCIPQVAIRTPGPVMTRGTALGCSGLLPFGSDALSVYVGMQTGAHPTAGALYDGAGKQLWLAPQDGPYPRSAAAADLSADGHFTIIVDNHGRHTFYDEGGKGRMVAHGWYDTIPGRGDGGKYTLPIVGPFGLKGETRIVMSSGLQAVETLDASGARLGKYGTEAIYTLEWCSSTVGRPRATGWDIGFVDHEGVLHCLDSETCKERWKLQVGPRSTTPVSAAAGDVDGDCRDEFVVGLPNGELLAVAEGEGKGRVLWRVTLEAAVRNVVLADADGDGAMDILAECDDGRVRLLR